MSEPLILVTNDDGVHAPGIRALADALEGLGEVFVVAPDREASASAQSLTLKHPLRAEKIESGTFAVDGTPADCVNLAIVKLLPRRPSLVVSGINRGGNMGDDVFYSGTVGAAREATFFGVHAIAMSLAARADLDYTPAARFARRLSKMVLERGPHLGNISYRVGRALTFDGKSEKFVDDKQADRLLTREYRKGFEIPSSFSTSSHDQARR